MDSKTFEALQTVGQLLADQLGHPKDEPIEIRICQPKSPCLNCLTIYVDVSGFEPCPKCGATTNCRHGWIVANKCVWCSERIAPSPVERIKYDPSWDFDDDYEDDNQSCSCGVIGCPECDAEYYENYDCGMGPDGQCGRAGSEECDWECPYSR